MSMTIQNETKVNLIQYKPEYHVLCSIGKRPFTGAVEIEFTPVKKLLEFMAFETWLNSLHDKEFTVESLCDTIFDKLTEELGYINLSVTVIAHTTAHANVNVTRLRDVQAEYNRGPKPTK